ncbi:hypothetical protein D3C77_659250 [compost metagenome]
MGRSRTGQLLEHAVKMRQAFEAAAIGNFANIIVALEQKLLSAHDSFGIDVIGYVQAGQLLEDAGEMSRRNGCEPREL